MLNLDRAALTAVANCPDGEEIALCTLVGIDGSFSRRLGAQIAIDGQGRCTGSLADGCLESQLVSEARKLRASQVIRYGKASPIIDFRLPCGSGIDVLIDPAPDRGKAREALVQLDARHSALLDLPLPPDAPEDLLRRRAYQPDLRVLLFGEGPEQEAFLALSKGLGISCESFAKRSATGDGLSLGQAPDGVSVDPWTAVLLLFHDHEWEAALLDWALATPAFYIGAQGGAATRSARIERLRANGHSDQALARICSPVGLIARARDPAVLALSVLAEIVAGYEALHPHT